MYDILMIEDNEELAEMIKTFLNQEGFSLYCVKTAETALAWLKQQQVRLLLLDVMLPGMDGFAFLQKLRKQQDIPVLMLSARTSQEDQLNGYLLGADDYIQKPVDTKILAAKLRALLTRAYGKKKKRLGNGIVTIDEEARQVYSYDKEIILNTKEYELLHCFLKHPQKTLHKEYLFSVIWGEDSESELQTLTVHIKMLRTKLEEDPRHPKHIITVWGIGYRYEE